MNTDQQQQWLTQTCGELAQIVVLDQVDSTNSWLLARSGSADQSARPFAVWALHQTAGRGRRARTWLADPNASIALSLGFARAAGSSSWPLTGLPLAIGVAVAQALSPWAPDIALKWPNDVQRGARKCGGILIETRLRADGHEWVVVGVGLNLLTMHNLQEAIAQPVCGVLDDAAAPLPARATIVAELIRQLVDCWQQFQFAGLASSAPRWHELDALRGQHVVVEDAGQRRFGGVAQGINAAGALRVATDAGVVEVFAGDVSVRAGKS